MDAFAGDTTHGQAYVHVDDVVEALSLGVQRRGRLDHETSVLIGEPETLSYGELQRTLGRLVHDQDWETKQIPKPVAKVGAWLEEAVPWGGNAFIKPFMIDIADDHYELDIGRARTLLGWEPADRLGWHTPQIVHALSKGRLRSGATARVGQTGQAGLRSR